MASSKTCILFFAQDSVATAKRTKKHLLFRKNSRTKVLSKLAQKTLNELHSTSLPIVTFSSRLQRGSCFGERLSNAISDTYDAGFDQVIVVGDDCPTLTAHTILKAHDDLDQDRLVLGPAIDGGVYLIGIHRDNFEKEIFTNLRWESEQLQDDLEQYVDARSCDITWYESHRDIDSFEDLLAFANDSSTNAESLKKEILVLIKAERKVVFNSDFQVALGCIIPFGLLRAPPALGLLN